MDKLVGATVADAVLSTAQNMANALLKKNLHLGDKALTALSNLQKIFYQTATTKKAAEDPARHTPTTKMTYLTAPALHPAP